jgi:hypothetical protein
MQLINIGSAAGRKNEEGEVKAKSKVIVESWMMLAEKMGAQRLVVDIIEIPNELYIIDLKKEWGKRGGGSKLPRS